MSVTAAPSSGGRIKVLQVIARMNVGGPAVQVVNLARGLDPDAFDVRVLTGSVEAGEEDYLRLRAPVTDVTAVPGLGRSIRMGGDVRALAALVGHLRRHRPDIIHTHTAKAGMLGRTAAVLASAAPRVHTFHGHLLSGYFSPTGTRAVVMAERALAHATDRIVAVGQQVRDDLLQAGIGRPDQYVVHPPGVQLDGPVPSRSEARRLLKLDVEAPVVAFVARLLAIKRPDRFLTAAAAVHELVPQVTFVVGGAGPLYESLQRDAAAARLPVRFLGWRSDVQTIYASADVVALTSDNEGMPVSLIEAAMCGRPAVATDVGSVREVVLDGVTGLVTRPDADDVAQAIVRVLTDAGLADRLGSSARLEAVRRFGTATLIAETERLYRSLLEDRRRRGG